MIPYDYITAWGVTHPWPSREQVEQDLLLSRAICAIAVDPSLGDELVFRGGTAFHKLFLDEALRYSEDLDYVRRRTASGIGPLTSSLSRLGSELRFEVRTRIGEHPKIYWRAMATSGIPLRLKIEINTHERSPALPLIKRRHTVSSGWWSGVGDVLTFQPTELVATKLRALYQRSKGRDLFDLWIALTQLALEPDDIQAAFAPYRPAGLTAALATANLRAKVTNRSFRSDIDPLVRRTPGGYSVDEAADFVTEQLLSRLDRDHP